ncbi:hypothetical protein RSAG8_10867, partial [Rhizoctonia solani AG-8 WAC10335]
MSGEVSKGLLFGIGSFGLNSKKSGIAYRGPRVALFELFDRGRSTSWTSSCFPRL